MENITCTMCEFSTNGKLILLKHMIRKHRHQCNFQIKCIETGCMYQTRTWNAFKLHFKRKHMNRLNGVANCEELDLDLDQISSGDTSLDLENIAESSKVNKVFAHAIYLLKLEAHNRLNKSTLNDIITATDELMTRVLNAERGFQSMERLSLFEGLKTDYLRRSFYTQHCNFVAPVSVLLGIDTVTKNSIPVLVRQHGFRVPFLRYLSVLLENEMLVNSLRGEVHDGNLMHDFRDGLYWKRSEILSDPEAIAIALYYDDIEVTNPLRSRHRSHKLSMFYFSIVNIHPRYISALHNIHWLAIGKTKYIKKFGVRALLKDFTDGINQLKKGCEMSVHGKLKLITGDLLVVLSDTPAGSFLGGFKESSMALKGCRMCVSDIQQAKTDFNPNNFVYRNIDAHNDKLDWLEGVGSEGNLTKKTRDFYKKTWGINGRSPLAEIDGFNFIECLPFDPMHTLLEGTFPYVCALFLYRMIYSKKIRKLSWLNAEIVGYDYSYMDSSAKPEPIAKSDLVSDLVRNTAAANLTLCYILPHILGPHIPEGYADFYGNLVSLIEIVLLCTSPVADIDMVGELTQKITGFCRNFKRLYPGASVKPKMHQMCHLPRCIQLFGPGRNFWCMRMEAKHSFFKGRTIRNHVNLPKSLADMHAFYMAYTLTGEQGGQNKTYLSKGDDIGDGEQVSLNIILEGVDAMEKEQILGQFRSKFSYVCRTLTTSGHVYKVGKCVILVDYQERWPIFGLLDKILIENDSRWFLIEELDTEVFSCRVNSYLVKRTGRMKLKKRCQLANKWPLPIQTHGGDMYITNRYSHFGGFSY